MSIGIKGKFIVGFDGVEHRLYRDGLVVIEGKRSKRQVNPIQGRWTGESTQTAAW